MMEILAKEILPNVDFTIRVLSNKHSQDPRTSEEIFGPITAISETKSPYDH